MPGPCTPDPTRPRNPAPASSRPSPRRWRLTPSNPYDSATAPPAVRPRDAASLIILKDHEGPPCVLMGRRTRRASFMPSVYVFPGGALEPADRRASGFPEPGTPLCPGLDGTTRRRYLSFLRAALRETYEETGLLIGRRTGTIHSAPGQPEIWRRYQEAGVVPAFADLRPVARAITPRVSPKRFHSRFFLVDGRLALGDPCDSEELEDVRWIPLEEFEHLPQTAEVTAAVLAEALRHRASPASETLDVALFSWVGRNERARHRRRYGAA